MIKETHSSRCTCSYCPNNGYDKPKHPGLDWPPQWWGWNAWWVWCSVNRYGDRTFWRFHPFFWLRRFQVKQ